MKIQRRVVNKETGEEEGTYQLIQMEGGFYWAFTAYVYDNLLPTLHLSKDRNTGEIYSGGLGGVLYFREEDFENSTTNN